MLLKLQLLCCGYYLEIFSCLFSYPILGEEGTSLQKRKSSTQKYLINEGRM